MLEKVLTKSPRRLHLIKKFRSALGVPTTFSVVSLGYFFEMAANDKFSYEGLITQTRELTVFNQSLSHKRHHLNVYKCKPPHMCRWNFPEDGLEWNN